MDICKVAKCVKGFVQGGAVNRVATASRNCGANVGRAVQKSAGKAPNYAAVSINGCIVYMPVEQAAKTKGVKILKEGLSSVDDILKAMQTYCNVI